MTNYRYMSHAYELRIIYSLRSQVVLKFDYIRHISSPYNIYLDNALYEGCVTRCGIIIFVAVIQNYYYYYFL